MTLLSSPSNIIVTNDRALQREAFRGKEEEEEEAEEEEEEDDEENEEEAAAMTAFAGMSCTKGSKAVNPLR
ncbi:hypothetical protein M0802_005539 [Mischocyttarus mexicanus]|nr:hypothetical protein M0802_005539 [Mischocyttarus mexicanus]